VGDNLIAMLVDGYEADDESNDRKN